jgi:hypothetical protein
MTLNVTAAQGRRISVRSLDARQRDRAKAGFATRRVPRTAMHTLIGGMVRPRAGDLVLAAVTRLGQHRKIEQPNGRRAALHVGDEILLAYADRYAPDQYESHVPADLRRAQLVASGGIASAMLTRSLDVRAPTDITPIGLVGDQHGLPLNVSDFALPPAPPSGERPRTIAVIGTSMNSGKTTTIHFLVHGLSRAGVRTGVTKVTGTGSGGDYWVMLDAGAHVMLDFTDAGLASTYRQPMPQIERTFVELTDHLTVAGCEVNFIEVADGIYQRETSRLIESEIFRSTVDVVLFAAPDAIGAVAGVAHLRSSGLDVAAVSGRITRSPLATREAQDVLGLPVLDLAQLGDAATVAALLGVDPQLLDAPVAEIPVSRPSPDLALVSSPEDPDDIDDHPASDEAVLHGDGTRLAGRR